MSGTKVTINVTDVHCTEMASLLDPLIKNGTVPPLSVFSPDFAKKYGGTADKVLMMVGPAWYTGVFHDTLKTPSGEMTAAPPLQWGTDTPVTTGQIGGGPWIISKHSSNAAAAADFVLWSTTVFNPPVHQPGLSAWSTGIRAAPSAMAYGSDLEQLLGSGSGPGYQGRSQPDLVWLEPSDLPRPARLVEHGGHRTCRREISEFADARIR